VSSPGGENICKRRIVEANTGSLEWTRIRIKVYVPSLYVTHLHRLDN
jgi:hypothetical protein